MPPSRRRPLSRERVLSAALALADARGFEALSMRTVARAVGVEAMSLYNHVASKEDLVDGLVELVFAEIELPQAGTVEWRTWMDARAHAVRAALRRHPWAVGLMEGRMQPGPASLRNHDAVLGCLREAGFPFRDAVHAYSVLDAYVYGFALQERSLQLDAPEDTARVMRRQRQNVPAMDDYPHLVEAAAQFAEAGWDADAEFAFGLDLVLDGVERLRAADLPRSRR